MNTFTAPKEPRSEASPERPYDAITQNPGTESTRLINGRPTDARLPKAGNLPPDFLSTRLRRSVLRTGDRYKRLPP